MTGQRIWGMHMIYLAKYLFLIVALIAYPGDLGATASFAPVPVALSSSGVLAICIFIGIIVVLLMEYAPPDITLFFGGVICSLTGLVSFEDFLKGFSAPVLLIFAMLFIVMKALEANGILNRIGVHLFSDRGSRSLQLLRICLPIMLIANGISNTILALFYTPLVKRWTLDRGLYPSEFLIPIAFLSILGCNMTIMGSAANLVVEALLEEIHQGTVFHFFTIAPLGFVVSMASLLFMLTIGHRLLPKRPLAGTPFHPHYSTTLTLRMTRESPLLGDSLGSLYHTYLRGLHVLEIHRLGQKMVDPESTTLLAINDAVILSGDVSRLLELKQIPGLQFEQDSTHRIDFSSTNYGEAVLSCASDLIGKTLKELEFRSQFGATVIGIYREGKRVESELSETPLRAGDVLFLISREPLDQKDPIQRHFFLSHQAYAQPTVSLVHSCMMLAILALMIVVAYVSDSLVYASCLAVVLIVALKLIDLRGLRKAVHWDLIVQIGSGMVYSKVLSSSGVAAWLAWHLHPYVEHNPYALVAIIFLITMLLAQVITTVACVLIVFPVAISLMHLAGFDGVSSMQAIGATLTMASSTCFLSPVGYQVNTIIYSQGGYRFGDFARVGLPLTLLVGVLSIVFIPWWWPLQYVGM